MNEYAPQRSESERDRLRHSPIPLANTFEDVRQEADRDADTGIGRDDPDMRVHAQHADRHATAARRVLDGAGEEIPDRGCSRPGSPDTDHGSRRSAQRDIDAPMAFLRVMRRTR
jgi:hypothetical protein